MKYMITTERMELKVAPTIWGTVPAPHSATLLIFSAVRILSPYSFSIFSTEFFNDRRILEDSEKTEDSFLMSRLINVKTGTSITRKDNTIKIVAQIHFFHLYLASISNIYFLIIT